MEKYREEVIRRKLEDIRLTHEVIIEKIAALEMELDQFKDGKIEEALRKVHKLVGESLRVIKEVREK